MNKEKIIVLIISGILILGFGLAIYFAKTGALGNSGSDGGKYNNFAECLAEKKFTMYGTDSCYFCQQEEQEFGSAWQYINYVECRKNPKICTEKNIEQTPTWIDGAENKYVGYQGLEKLAEISGCELPSQ